MKKKCLNFWYNGSRWILLGRILLKKKYVVHGVKRRSSSFNTGRIDHLYQDHMKKKLYFCSDVTDAISVSSIIENIKPDEIYNLL